MNNIFNVLDFTITDLLGILRELFGFLVDMLGDFAEFFTTNMLGQIILGIIIFSIMASLVSYIINRMK